MRGFLLGILVCLFPGIHMSLSTNEMEDIDKLLDEADQFYRKDESVPNLMHSTPVSKPTRRFEDFDVSRYTSRKVKI